MKFKNLRALDFFYNYLKKNVQWDTENSIFINIVGDG